MTNLTGQERATYVQNMFTQIAKRYDLMNRLMTGFQDVRWRKQVIRLARLTNGASLLDLGTGTGDLAGCLQGRGHPGRTAALADRARAPRHLRGHAGAGRPAAGRNDGVQKPVSRWRLD